MRFSANCVRDILFVIEDTEDVLFPCADERLALYSDEEVLYHVKQCHHSDLVLGFREFIDGSSCEVSDLSPAGHDLLARIRSNTVWSKIKKTVVASVPALIKATADLIGGS